MRDADETWVPDAPAEPAPGSTGLLAGRYELGAVIGRGGSAEVVEARDRLTGERVAVKWVPLLGPHAHRLLRRELSALLALRLPGVVRLRDDGTVGDRSFFVTDRIDGVPYTVGCAPGWESWRPRVIGLLDVLARVHLAGVVHRDLKPANVLVDRAERVVLLDFGLAQGRLVERGTGGWIEGTPLYMAPEQLRAEPCDERTDLYAAGAMIFELVTGRRWALEPAGGRGELIRAAVPAALAEQVERMLAVDPAHRPRSALAVLEAIDADPRADLGAGLGPGPWTERALRALFVDRRRSFLHLAEDGARLLFAEAHGDPRATRATLERWIGAGLVSWSGDGRVVIAREAIEQIAAGRPGSPQAKLVAMLEAGAEPDEVSRAARAIGARLARSGHLERALGVLDAAELWARGTPSELGVLQDRVAWSLGLQTQNAVDRALYRVQRSELAAEDSRPLELLLRGGRAAFGGDPHRALELLDQKPQGLPERLEGWWHGARWKAASQLDFAIHERELDSISDWAACTPLRTSQWTGWRGYLRYRQQRYREAAELLLIAARTRPPGQERAQMSYMASAAFLELNELEHARRLARSAASAFRRGRNPTLEAQAVYVIRAVALRMPEPPAPNADWVDAGSDVPVGSLLSLVEAGIAFRHSDFDQVVAWCDGIGVGSAVPPDLRLLSEALAFAANSERSLAPDWVDRVGALSPQIGLQVIGLVASRTELPPEVAALVAQWSNVLDARNDEARLDLVSVGDLRQWLGPHLTGRPA
ncbi:MAG: serine/threonine-protein kinase [Myxococcota bacterium]